jgi:hypothetical protein
MEDLSAKLEKLLIEAEDCELISRLATDHDKRQLFKKLAVDLCGMAEDIQAMISTRTPEAVSHEIKDGRMVAFSIIKWAWKGTPQRSGPENYPRPDLYGASCTSDRAAV